MLHEEPTVLIARLRAGPFRAALVPAHGPHRGHEVQHRCQRFAGICKSFDDGLPWVLMLAANARVGSVQSEVIGEWHADEQDAPGAILHQPLLDLRAHLPATFQGTMHGAGGTLFVKRNRSMARSDFVALPVEWRGHPLAAWVSEKNFLRA